MNSTCSLLQMYYLLASWLFEQQTHERRAKPAANEFERNTMKKNDFILAGVVLAVALLALGYLYFCRHAGSEVLVSVEGVTVARYALDEDRVVTVSGKDGGTNILVIESGKVHIMEADCPDLLCVKQGEISYTGQSIVCLPNQVVVEITGGNKDAELDAVAQ